MITRPKLNLKQAYERVKSALTGVLADIAALWPIAKNSAGNGIYNGKMTISQRGDYTSPTAVSTGDYYLDRWLVHLGGVTATVQDTGGTQKIVATSTASGYLKGQQKIEDYASYAGKTITISGKITSNSSDALFVIQDASTVIAASSKHTGSGEEEILSVTFTTSSSLGDLTIRPSISTAGGGNVSITSGDYIEFTDVRLDLGSHRLSGDREYGEELALCRGYWYHPDLSGGSFSKGGEGFAISTTVASLFIHTRLNNKADTVDYSALADFKLSDGVSSFDPTAIAISGGSTPDLTILTVTVASGLTQFRSYQLQNNSKTTSTLGVGNEL